MSSNNQKRTKTLKVLTSLVGILSVGSLFTLPAFSQSNDSPSDARTLPRGTTDAPRPMGSDAQNNYPVNQDENSPARIDRDGMNRGNSDDRRELNSPARIDRGDSDRQRDLNSPARTNQDGTIMPNNNRDDTNRSPSLNQDGEFDRESGSNDLQRTTATPFPNPNLPYDSNLTPRQNLNQEGGSEE